MDATLSLARPTRTHYRHELRTLTYVVLDQANGGIVRNVTRDGIGVQAVAALRLHQQLLVRFELRTPRLRVETRGEVMWSTLSGQCGIRFLDLAPRVSRQLQEWIFGNLLEGISLHWELPESMFTAPALRSGMQEEVDDGLMVSSTPLSVIELPIRGDLVHRTVVDDDESEMVVPLAWLSQPLSKQGLTWTINALVVLAGLLLFALIFLSVTSEAPTWPITTAGALFVVVMYWGFFELFGGSSLGARLARLAAFEEEEEEVRPDRFR
jgi:hypothetical protein